MSQLEKNRVKRWRRDVWRVYAAQGFKPAEIMAAMVLAAVAAVGTDVSVLSELTGHSTDYVKKVLKRLRAERLLSGQTLRVAGDNEVAIALDAGVAAGLFARFPNEKRSAAQKARKPETRARGPRRKRATVSPGAMFTPKLRKADTLYGLPDWKGSK